MVQGPDGFEDRLLAKIREQIGSARVGFLLGAGASYLEGKGYPLAASLWPDIATELSGDDRRAIQEQLDRGTAGLEEALDRLDDDPGEEFGLRQRVACAIADRFRSVTPPLATHGHFLRGLTRFRERRVALFGLNYDPLVELAAEEAMLFIVDGFSGSHRAFFHPASYTYHIGHTGQRRGRRSVTPLRGIINYYKLHGSQTWFREPTNRASRRSDAALPAPGVSRLMIPPHYRKAQETSVEPYATLWSEFRAFMVNDHSRLLNRLVCVGYGLRDSHVNPILMAARARRDFTLIVLARSLADEVFSVFSDVGNVILVTENRCALYGEVGPGVSEAWSFEWLAKEVGRHA